MKNRNRTLVVFFLILVVHVVASGTMPGQTRDIPVLTVCGVMHDLAAYKGHCKGISG
jgi:hypothetical protein